MVGVFCMWLPAGTWHICHQQFTESRVRHLSQLGHQSAEVSPVSRAAGSPLAAAAEIEGKNKTEGEERKAVSGLISGSFVICTNTSSPTATHSAEASQINLLSLLHKPSLRPVTAWIDPVLPKEAKRRRWRIGSEDGEKVASPMSTSFSTLPYPAARSSSTRQVAGSRSIIFFQSIP